MTPRQTSDVEALGDGARHRTPRRNDHQDQLQPAGNAAQVQLLTSGRGPVMAASLRSLQRTAGNRAVAQLLARPAAGPVVQRMSVGNTNWAGATSAVHSAGGGVGVFIFDDGTMPVVVKAGENFLSEAAVASAVLSHGTGGGAGGWTASSPDARPVGAAEAKVIRQRALALLPPDQQASPRTQTFLDSLDNNDGVMVYGHAGGSDFDKLFAQSQTKGKGLGKRKVDENSISHMLMNDPGLMETFGRSAAADIVLGNVDRFIGKINLGNVMVDKASKSIHFIDNVEARDPAVLRDMPQYNMTGYKGFLSWANEEWPKRMAAQDWGGIAKLTIANLRKELAGGGLKPVLRKDDQEAVLKAYDKRTPLMTQWFADGLWHGATTIRKAFRDPRPFTYALPPQERDEVATNLLARYYFLQQISPDDAWNRALFEVPFWNTGPDRPAAPTPGGQPPANAAAAAAPARGRAGGFLGGGHRTRVGQ